MERAVTYIIEKIQNKKEKINLFNFFSSGGWVSHVEFLARLLVCNGFDT